MLVIGQPNASLLHVVNSAPQSAHGDVIALLGSTNDTVQADFGEIYKHLEKKLTSLGKTKRVLMLTIPRRYDTDIYDPVRNKINLSNHYIRELTRG